MKTDLSTIGCLMLLSAMLASVGCKSYQPGRVATEAQAIQDAYPQVVVIGDLHITKHNPIVTPAEGSTPMQVVVPLRLRSDKSQEVQYRFIFLDGAGRPVGPEMDWRWAVMPARALIYLDGSALSNKAVDWRMQIRPNLKSK